MAKYIKSVQKAIDILDYIAEKGEVGVTELSKKFSMSKSSAHGYLNTFFKNNWIDKNDVTDKYKLGLHLFELGNFVRDGFKIREIAIPYMKKIVDKTGETVHLTLLDNGEVVYLESAQPENKLSIASIAGRRAPLYCTGVGKAILAFKSEEFIDDLLNKIELKRFTVNTITDPDSIKKNLKKKKKRGYSIDNAEHEEGVICVGVPIYNAENEVFASLSLTGPSPRIKDPKIEEYSIILKEAALEISRDIGWSRSNF